MAREKKDKVYENREVTVERRGTSIVLPDDPRAMTYDEAIESLHRIKEQEGIKIGVHEEIEAFPLEGAWALTKVLKEMFGYTLTPQAVQTMFGEMPAASSVNLEVGPGKHEQVLWGSFKVPGVDGTLQTNVTRSSGLLTFVITGTIKKKDQATVKRVADGVRQFVRENSLYKGEAVKIETVFDHKDGLYKIEPNRPPKFLDLEKVSEDELTFSKDVGELINTNLFVPLEEAEKCRELNVPLRRNVLLEGPYGTGKTLTAFVAAKKAQKNNWTFIYLDRVEALKDALLFARRYSPAIIFAEDIESVMKGGRKTSVNDILNTIDGIDAKNQEVMCIFTTNHVEKIEKAMLRPGRLDAVISVQPPDAAAAEKLIRVYARGLIGEGEDLSGAAKELAGQIPAMIRETVERSKLFAITNHTDGSKLKITGENVRLAAVQMKGHMKLIADKGPRKLTNGEQLERVIATILRKDYQGRFCYDEDENVISDTTMPETLANGVVN